jgi:ribosome modulation factor
MTDSDAFEAGYDAYWDGAACDENPYDQEREAIQYNSWHQGWREAWKHDYDDSEG